ncbi:MAG: glucokinase, partial [Hyphomonadaceae bacterium]|nr:glucokinase [Hyphomonadaceae bacterium]
MIQKPTLEVPILVGDVGGTNVRFGLAHRDEAEHLAIEAFSGWPGNDFPTLRGAIGHYLERSDVAPTAISLAVAGPVADGMARLTNRDWSISVSDLDGFDGIDNVALFNDFEAMARSVPEMSAQDFKLVHDGQSIPDEPILVAGPGTGFGVSFIIPDGDTWRVMNTEGGHQAYSPRSPVECEILDILHQDYDFVSLEMISSGSGLDLVHRAVSRRHGVPYEHMSPAELRKCADDGNPVCVEVCDIRAAATMGAIGDLVLSGGARGGVVLA